jgi:uncharacterized protein (TIGR02231 family)
VSHDHTIQAAAVEVVFFEDRARVRREADVSLVAGPQTLLLSGAGLAIDDSSLSVALDGPGAADVELLSWRVLRRVRVIQAADEARRCRDAYDDAERALEAAKLRIARLDTQRRMLMEAEDALLAEAPKLLADEIGPWSEALDDLDTPLNRWLDEDAEARADLEERELELARARARLTLATTERREVEAVIELQLMAPAAGSLRVAIEYITPCAAWRPAHRAELRDLAGQPTLVITSVATAWQATGERWERIRCAFSTARPTQAASPPALTDDRLYTRPKTEQERRVVEVEARDVTIQLTGTVDGTRQTDAMPGVDDGGEPLRFSPSRLVTIPSDGKPFRVELDEVTLPCKVDLVAFPELATVAHLRALATWTGKTPLLAGPVTLRRESEVVGTARLKFVGPGDSFELGFGPDDALRVRRSVTQKTGVRRLTRRNYLEREVALYTSNLSDQPRTLILIERVPVSEIADVSVQLDPHNPADPDKDGFVRIVQQLPARRNATSTIKYTVDYGSNVNLRF